MKFSILIANFNNGKYFKDCFDSLLFQTYENWEAIVVDDCSTDSSIDDIKKLIGNDARFKLFINDRNYGCGYTKRKCAELAQGEVCGFVDPDDAIEKNALALMIKTHENNPDCCLVHSKFTFCDQDLNCQYRYDIAGPVNASNKFTNLEGKVNHFATFKNSYYKKTLGIDSKLIRAVDQDLYLKMAETGSFIFINRSLYKYRIHNKGISTLDNVDKSFYWFLKVIAKAEERRNVNLENEVASFLNRTNPNNLAINLANPRYLLLKLAEALKAKPTVFIKKLFGK